MSILQKIRLGAAIVLFCAIFLPLSQCSSQKGGTKTPQALAHAGHLFPRSDKDFRYQYAIKEIDFSLGGALTLIAFVWPLAFAIWSRKSRLRRFWWIFYTGELLLCAGTANSIYALTQEFVGEVRWLYGFYVAETTTAIYATTTLISIVDRIRRWRGA
jgi:hypothetical protein